MTQVQEFLTILRMRSVNSLEPLRQRFVQMPRIIKDLQKMGYVIEHKPSYHQSTTYTLLSEPEKPQEPEYIFTQDGYALKKEDIKQQNLL